jgi:MFS family permease
MILFPHYQAFAREQFGNTGRSLLTWIVVQNIATGLASLVVGPLADHRGNRLVIIGLLGCCTGTPLFVAALSMASQSTAVQWFWLAYIPLGFNPIMLRIISNYALELAPTVGLQPRYVSLVGVAMAIPFVLSPIVGWGIDVLGGIPFFLAGAASIALGTLVAFGLPEPRNSHFKMQKS